MNANPNIFAAKYRFISDPGHGWLEVPSSEVTRLGVKPSTCSYVHKGKTYLEEDCDANLFIAAKQSRNEPFTILEFHFENVDIRGYRHVGE